MKKLLVFVLVAILAFALVACGNDPANTTEGSENPATQGPAATTKPGENNVPDTDDTPEPPQTDAPPLYPGIDILNGDLDNAAVTPNWKGVDCIAFEEHKALDFRVALVFHMDETVNGIYEDLVITTTTDETVPNTENWEMNSDYRWELTIDGVVMEITSFSLLNDKTSGYIRMDLGDWTYSDEVDEFGYHEYDCLLKIYGTDNEIAYWAWFTDPDWNDKYIFAKPDPIVMVDDENRNPDHVAIPNVGNVEPTLGPDGWNADELYYNLFDDTVRAKLCCGYNGEAGGSEVVAIEWMLVNGPKSIASYSFVGANDDEQYSARVPKIWKLYGSNNGTTWEVMDEQNLETVTAVNYGERNFALETPTEYQYFRLEITVTEMWQMSDIILYTEAE